MCEWYSTEEIKMSEEKVSKKAKEKEEVSKPSVAELELELLKEKIKSLEQARPTQDKKEEDYIKRLEKYNASKEARDAKKEEIEKKKMVLMTKNHKLRMDEATVIVGLQERAASMVEGSPDRLKIEDYIQSKLKFAAEDDKRG